MALSISPTHSSIPGSKMSAVLPLISAYELIQCLPEVASVRLHELSDPEFMA